MDSFFALICKTVGALFVRTQFVLLVLLLVLFLLLLLLLLLFQLFAILLLLLVVVVVVVLVLWMWVLAVDGAVVGGNPGWRLTCCKLWQHAHCRELRELCQCSFQS
jgi:hypothetical protein